LPVTKFRDGKTAVKRIWGRIERLGDSVATQSKSESVGKDRVQRKAKRGAPAAQGELVKGGSGKKAIASTRTPKSQKTAKVPETSSSRAGTKTAQVVAMLQRKGGATRSRSWRRWAGNGTPSAGLWLVP
jgi:hypothetical protein